MVLFELLGLHTLVAHGLQQPFLSDQGVIDAEGRVFTFSGSGRARQGKRAMTTESRSPPSRPHIIFMLADDMGWNDVGYHNPSYGKNGKIGEKYLGNGKTDGKNDVRTPTINRLAEEGMKLESMYAHEVCSPSRAALLTGRYPSHTGIGPSVVKPCDTYGVPKKFAMLPKVLKKYEYKTYLVGKWHLGMAHEDFTPTKRGFDEWFGVSTGECDFFSWYYNAQVGAPETTGSVLVNATNSSNLKDGSAVKFLKDFPNFEDPASTASHLVYAREVDRILAKHADGGDLDHLPSFIYMAFQSPHEGFAIKLDADDHNKFDPANKDDHHVNQWLDADGKEQICKMKKQGNCARRSFLEMMSDMDDAIAAIEQSYIKHGLWDNTVLIFQSDNGGAQYGPGKSRYSGSNYPLPNQKGKKNTAEGGIRVPCFIRSTFSNFQVPAGEKSFHLMHIVDWYPTLESIARGNDPHDGVHQKLDGIDMSERILGHTKERDIYEPRKSIIHTAHPGCEKCGVVRHGKYKWYGMDGGQYKASLPDQRRAGYNGNDYLNIKMKLKKGEACYQINEYDQKKNKWKKISEKSVHSRFCKDAKQTLKDYLTDNSADLLIDWRLKEPEIEKFGESNPCKAYSHLAIGNVNEPPMPTGAYFKIGWYDPDTSELPKHLYDFSKEMLDE